MWSRQSAKVRDAVFQFGVEQKPPIPPRPPDLADWTPERREHWFQHEFRDGWELYLIKREVELRNDAAHPTMQAVYMPGWSATEIEALALFVNLLWSAPSTASQ